MTHPSLLKLLADARLEGLRRASERRATRERARLTRSDRKELPMIYRSPFAAPSSQRGCTQTATIRPRSLLRALASATRRVREPAANEDRARLIAHFAALEHAQHDPALELMWRQPARDPLITRPDDPLELLWNLPARRPRRPR